MEVELDQAYLNKASQILESNFDVNEMEGNQISKEVYKDILASASEVIELKSNQFWNYFYTYAKKRVKSVKISMSKNFGLTETEFEEMRLNLKRGDEKVFEKIFLNHFESCISYLIKNHRIDYELAYDISMDTLIDFRTKLIQDKISYGNLRFLFTRMATQKHLKQIAKAKKTENISSIFESEDLEEDLVILEKALAKLGENCRDILKLNYYDKMTLNNIATLKDVSHAAMRKQKQRCIFTLKNLFRQFSI